jgi:3-mercaptopyruvate sulfurtransferase SseA
VHCETSGRSPIAVSLLQKLGVEDVLELEGGYQAWREAGFAIEADAPTPEPAGAISDGPGSEPWPSNR